MGKLRINLPAGLTASQNYYLTMDQGFLVDANTGQPLPAITLSDGVSFQANNNPTDISTTPPDNQFDYRLDIDVPSKRVDITFEELIKPGIGSIRIYREDTVDVLIESFNVATQVIFTDGSPVVSIYPSANLEGVGETYYIIVDDGAIVNYNCFSTLELDSRTSADIAVDWNRHIAPNPALDTSYIQITFCEDVFKGTGIVSLYREDTVDELIETIDVSGSSVSNAVMVLGTQYKLEGKESYYITAPKGIVTNSHGLSYKAIVKGDTDVTQTFHAPTGAGQIAVQFDRNIISGTGSMYLKRQITNEVIKEYVLKDSDTSTLDATYDFAIQADIDELETYPNGVLEFEIINPGATDFRAFGSTSNAVGSTFFYRTQYTYENILEGIEYEIVDRDTDEDPATDWTFWGSDFNDTEVRFTVDSFGGIRSTNEMKARYIYEIVTIGDFNWSEYTTTVQTNEPAGQVGDWVIAKDNITGLDPLHDGEGSAKAVGTNLVSTSYHNKGDGVIKLYDASGEVTDAYMLKNRVLLNVEMEQGSDYYVTIDATSITDADRLPFAGYSLASDWDWFMYNGPTVTTAVNTAPQELTLTYNEDILDSGHSDDMVIHLDSDDSVVKTLSMPGDMLIVGNTVTVNPDIFDEGQAYYVLHHRDMFKNDKDYVTREVTNKADITFTSVGAMASFDPPDNSVGVVDFLANGLTVTFDRNITAAAGSMHMYRTSDDLLIESWDIATDITVGATTLNAIPTVPLSEENYYVLIDSGIVTDLDGTTFKGLTSTIAWNFILDGLDLVSTAPVDEETGVSDLAIEGLVAHYDDLLTAGTGNVVMHRSSDDSVIQSFDITSEVTLVTDTFTTDPVTAILDSETDYYVKVDAGALIDSNGILDNGITDTTTWNFTVDTGPVYSSSNPLDDAAGVRDLDIVMTMNENITANTGNIYLYKTAGNVLMQTWDITTDVSIVGADITITNNTVLEPFTAYHVMMDPAAVSGASLITTPGIIDPSTFNFATGEVAVVTYSPLDNASNVRDLSEFAITFDRDITANTGNFYLKKTAGDILMKTWDITSDVNILNNVLTLPSDVFLDSTTEYYITADADVVYDSDNIYYDGISSTTEWSFTTDEVSVTLLDPLDNAVAVDQADFILTFDQDVEGIALKEFHLVETGFLPVITWTVGTDVTIAGNQVTLTNDTPLKPDTAYHIEIDDNALASQGLYWDGITDTATWNFTTGNTTIVSAYDPVDGTIDFSSTVPSITFNRNVVAESGNFYLKKTIGDVAIEVFDVTTDVTIVGPTVSLPITANLESNVEYYITSDANVVSADLMYFSGILSTTEWNFEFAEIGVLSTVPIDDAINAVPAPLSITFNGTITANTGNIDLYNASGPVLIDTWDITTGVTILGDTVTTDTAPTYVPGDDYYVVFPTGLVTVQGLESEGYTAPTDWNFTVVDIPAVVSTFPVDNAVNVTVDDLSNFAITFDNNNIEINSGNIYLYETVGDVLVETIDVTTTSISGNNTLDIDLTDYLPEGIPSNTDYYILFDAGIVKDQTSQFECAAMTLSTDWNFTTGVSMYPLYVTITPTDFVTPIEFGAIDGGGRMPLEVDSGNGTFVTIDQVPAINIVPSGVVRIRALTSVEEFNSEVGNSDNIVCSVADTAGFVARKGTLGGNGPLTVEMHNIESLSYLILSENSRLTEIITDGTTTGGMGVFAGQLPFSGCSSLETFPSGFDYSTCTSFNGMFLSCSSLLCLPEINTTAVGATKTDMFTGCTSLIQPDAAAQTDITDVNGANWTNPGVCPPVLELVSSVPLDNAFDITDLDVAMTFNFDVTAQTGNFYLHETVGDALIESWDVTTDVTIIGDTVTLPNNVALDPLTEYYVLADNTILTSAFGDWAGITNTTELSFTTADVTYTTVPLDDAIDVNISDISITFDADITANIGNVYVYETVGNVLVDTYDVTTDVSIVGDTLTVASALDLLVGGTEYYVLIDANAVNTIDNIYFSGITSTTAWSFTMLVPVVYDLSATITPITGASNKVTVYGGDYEVDWGNGTFIGYTADLPAESASLGEITVRSSNAPTRIVIDNNSNNVSSVDITKSSTLTSLLSACKNITALTSFAINDASNVVDFSQAWSGCSGLTSFPAIDASSGETFNEAWRSCSGLTSFPVITLGSALSMVTTWFGCSGLTEFPLLDFSTVTSFANCWYLCTGLESFPAINTVSGTNFASMWRDCTSLVCIGAVNTLLQTSTTSMFTNTPLLVAPTAGEQTTILAGSNYVNPGTCPSFDLLVTATPLDFVTSNTITVQGGDYEVDWGAGFVSYSDGVAASAIASSNITVQSVNSPTQITFNTDTYTAIDITESSTLTNAQSMCNSKTQLISFNMSDSSNITNFIWTWRNCSGLTSFPLIDTSAGINFANTWDLCSGLTSFPLIDTSAGINFGSAWARCSGLTSFPAINTSLGAEFDLAWWDCSGLTSFPLIDTSSGTNFGSAWSGCSGLTSFPLIDTSSGTDFPGAWRDCTGLTTFPAINTSAGDEFDRTWNGCSGLTSFPAINTSLGVSFWATWENCTSLICLSSVDTTSAFTKTDMFNNTPALVQPDVAAIIDLEDANGANWTNPGTCP